jgi:NADP-dependent 3-hydroxy acid dehydrogenase YdfG
MSRPLEGRVAAITGASSGIGAATARAFAAEGMAVSMAARREERLRAVAADIVAAGGRALPVVADVTDETAMRTFVTRTLAAFGRLDAVVCNAGIGFYGTMDETSSAVMQRLMDVNFMGTFHTVRAALPYFEQQGHGHVLIVSSILGRRAIPYSAAYAATKFAQVGLAEALRSEYASSGIAVSVVYPVGTETELRATMQREHGVLVRGRGPRQTAEEVAQTLVGALVHPRPEIYPYRPAQALAALSAVAPRLADRLVRKYGRSRHRDPDEGA